MPGQDENESVNRQLINLASDRTEAYEAAFSWFIEQGPDITAELVRGLDDELLGSVGHWRILQLLERFAVEATFPAIVKALYDALDRRDPIVLPAAMNALAAFRSPETTSTLIGLLKHNDPDVVKHAASLLGRAGDLDATGPLLLLLNNDDRSIRYSAARGLIQFDDRSVRAALKKHLESESDAEVRKLIESAVTGGSDESGQ